jgi:hypothetical protein
MHAASEGGGSVALDQLSGAGVHTGSLINVEVPMQQLAGVKSGDIVKGKNGDLSWTGAVTKDSTLSPTQGCVTVRVISDKYIAPGTPVSGKVGDAAFMGTVVGAPNFQERIGSMERRISALEPSAKGSVTALKNKLDRMKRSLSRMEGHKTIEERMEELSKRVIDLERRPVIPSPPRLPRTRLLLSVLHYRDPPRLIRHPEAVCTFPFCHHLTCNPPPAQLTPPPNPPSRTRHPLNGRARSSWNPEP